MRLSTEPERASEPATAVIHAALDAGATLLDTADAYCHDETDVGHNERLIAEALQTWSGDRSRITVATKGGLRRPGGRWVPDGRARHLRAACEASRAALNVDTIDLYQLHAVDPRTSLATSVRALAGLQREGLIREIGLCNVTVAQIETARAIAEIASVQVSLSTFDDTNLRNGVAEYCRDEGIRLIAYRPLSGRPTRFERAVALLSIAERHGVTAQEMGLAWLLDLDPCVVPVPGATRVATAQSLGRALRIELTDEDRAALESRFPAGRLLRVPRALRRPAAAGNGDIVLVMGMPAAGKSTMARTLVDSGYVRLNRDDRGGSLSDLVTALDDGLAAGGRRWVLDNTYASRGARNEVIECAWRHGVPVRCIHLATSIADAQINAITRLLEVAGHLPPPEELKERGRQDTRFFGPDAQFRYLRQLEPPTPDEGFESVDEHAFERRAEQGTDALLILDLDDVCASPAPVLDPAAVAVADAWRTAVGRRVREGAAVVVTAWRPQIASGAATGTQVRQCFAGLEAALGVPIAHAWCPHPAGPPVCWCRKPIPGMILAALSATSWAPRRSLVVGGTADRTMAERLGTAFLSPQEFLEASG